MVSEQNFVEKWKKLTKQTNKQKLPKTKKQTKPNPFIKELSSEEGSQ